MKRFCWLFLLLLITTTAQAKTNELSAPGWVQPQYIVPVATGLAAGEAGRYSVVLSEILALKPALNWLGEWQSGTAYLVDAVVSYNSGLYICTQATTAGIVPTNTSYWDAAVDPETFATAAQGAKADTALQPNGDGSQLTGLPGGGDMFKATYDPGGKEADVYARASHTGTQAIATVSGLQAALDGKQAAGSPPTAHGHPAAEISDSGTAGRAVMQSETQADGRTALGLGTMSTAASGTGIGQHPPLVDVGVCSDTQYTSQATCTTGGGTWTAAAGWRIPGADFPAGGLTVGGVAVTPGTAAWDSIPDKPSEFQPVAHEHAQADITGLVARLDAMDAQIAALDANLSLAGFPSLTIDQTGTVAFTAATTTLTGTATDSGSITALEYQIDGGAWANITPLTSPWSQDIAGTSLTPNVASTVTVRATDDTALERTKSVQLVYQTPVLAFSGDSGAFSTVDVNTTSAAQSYTLTNSGLATSATLTTAKSGTDPTQFDVTVDTCNGNTLAPAGTCNVNVTYSPDAAATHTASLDVGGQSVALSGTGVSPVTYLINHQDFEGAGTPSGWTAGSTNINYDYSTAGLSLGGNEALRLWKDSGGSPVVQAPFSGASSTVFAKTMLRMDSRVETSIGFIYIRDSLNNPLVRVDHDGHGQARLAVWGSAATVGSWTAADTFKVNTTQHVKVAYTRTGADATATLWLSTDGVSWTSTATVSTATADKDASKLEFNYVAMPLSSSLYFDDVAAATSDF